MKTSFSTTRFMTWSARMAGKPMTFIVAWAIFIFWFILGLFWGFTTQWILIIDTIATLNASFMVFVIQNTQYRENKALHIKIDELIRATEKAEKNFIAIEEKEESEIEEIKSILRKKLKEH